jgi:hypothetical protein
MTVLILFLMKEGKKVNLLPCLINKGQHHKDIWGNGGIVPPFLTLALVEDELSGSLSGHFTPKKIAE